MTWILMVLVIGLTSFCGWTLTQIESSIAANPPARPTLGTVDIVPQELKLAQETYLARCATCHVGIPPAVLPSESWKTILQDTNHYGVPWESLRNPDLALAWKYTRSGSRPLNPDEQIPYRIRTSRYFKIFHPKVKFTEPVAVGTCVSCHIGAPKFNFRDLSPQWQDAP
ncbi:MAG: cytochrome C [Acaryochloridaceae cyanobacterium RU_4_10]|nr:cytochrome C [Acaryochloridaceae cyanobacterium RU_4_10]